MKKALVLGVLALFAINFATVNAQDRCDKAQQQKPKTVSEKPYAKGKGETKAVNQQAVKEDPTVKQVKQEAPAIQEPKKAAPVSQEKKVTPAAPKSKMVKTTKEKAEVGKQAAAKPATVGKAEGKTTEKTTTIGSVKNDPTQKKNNINNSVPPTPKKPMSSDNPKANAAQTR